MWTTRYCWCRESSGKAKPVQMKFESAAFVVKKLSTARCFSLQRSGTSSSKLVRVCRQTPPSTQHSGVVPLAASVRLSLSERNVSTTRSKNNSQTQRKVRQRSQQQLYNGEEIDGMHRSTSSTYQYRTRADPPIAFSLGSTQSGHPASALLRPHDGWGRVRYDSARAGWPCCWCEETSDWRRTARRRRGRRLEQ